MASRRSAFSMNHPVIITFLLFAIIAFMYLAAEALKPLALAILLSFALVPISKRFEQFGMPRVLAVVLTTGLVLGALGFIGYRVSMELDTLADKLPQYQETLTKKINEFMKPGQASVVTKAEELVKGVGKTLQPDRPREGVQQVQLVPTEPDFGEQISKLSGPYLEGIGTAFIILILMLFMMINREDLGDRMIRLFGKGKISLTTRTIEEVGQRISKYLVMFATVNSAFGLIIGVGLYFIGVEYAFLWGFLAGLLRFIPYAGAATAFSLPLLFTIVTTKEGWFRPLEVVALFGVLEVAMNVYLEPVIYGRTTGVSALALLVAAMFWTWLWGGIGLLLSTPLTVCLAVLGKYVPSLSFFATFLHEEVDLEPGVRFYQRLLAMDQDGATAVVDSLLKKHPRAEVFDKVIVPTLSLAERDYARDDIDDREQAFIFRVVADVIEDLEGEPETNLATLAAVTARTPTDGVAGDDEGPKILAIPANDATDALVLKILKMLSEGIRIRLDVAEQVEAPLRLVERIAHEEPDAILISHLPPDGLTAARYLVRRIRAKHVKVPILIGRWDEASDAETASERLGAAGATAVFGSLAEARDYLAAFKKVQVETAPVGITG